MLALLFITSRNAKWYNHFGIQFGSYLLNYTYSHMIQQSQTPWYLPKEIKNLHLHKHLHMDTPNSFIHKWQNLETSKMSFSR